MYIINSQFLSCCTSQPKKLVKKTKFVFRGETTDLKYRINVKVEKNVFQMMSFGAKLEHRRPKYRSSKIANFGILPWIATRCSLKAFSSWFSKVKRKHRN